MNGWVYRNLFVYRLVMQLLYSGRYWRRFQNVIDLLLPPERRIVELCFGDIAIAEYCRTTARVWVGFDINEDFVDFARRQGYIAETADIAALDHFPPADVCIICGSLYHFHDGLRDLLTKMLSAAPRIIISEPICNLSSSDGILGSLARTATDVGIGSPQFRFTPPTLLESLSALNKELGFCYRVISVDRDMLLVIDRTTS